MNEILSVTFMIIARLSYYDPSLCALGPEYSINCFDPAQWWSMSGGLYDARENYWQALACPRQFPLGTRFVIQGSRWGLADGEWTCLDAGGAIYIEPDGTVRLDLLTDTPIWADVLPVQVKTQPEQSQRIQRAFPETKHPTITDEFKGRK